MLAHTTSRYFILGSQLAIGVVLLSASYFVRDDVNANTQLKASVEQSPAVQTLQSKRKHC